MGEWLQTNGGKLLTNGGGVANKRDGRHGCREAFKNCIRICQIKFERFFGDSNVRVIFDNSF